MLESEFWTKRVQPLLSKIPDSFWERINDKSKRGIPDVWGCVNGRAVILELKRSKTAAAYGSASTNLQKYMLEKYRKAGKAICFMVYPENLNDVYEQILLLTGDYDEKETCRRKPNASSGGRRSAV